MALPFLSNVPRRGSFKLQSNTTDQTSPMPPPVTVMPVTVMVTPAPVTTTPAPVTAVPVMAPMHLFGLELVNFLARRHCGMGVLVRRRKWIGPGKRLRREWCGLRACGKRGAGHESEGKSEKMSAFHVLRSFAFATMMARRVWRSSAECVLNQAFRNAVVR
jgi:hypothetical protein